MTPEQAAFAKTLCEQRFYDYAVSRAYGAIFNRDKTIFQDEIRCQTLNFRHMLKI